VTVLLVIVAAADLGRSDVSSVESDQAAAAKPTK